MTLSWIAKVFSPAARRQPARRPRFVRPELESLEQRITPSNTRSWVSGVGDDANPGSITAPDKTFAGALANTAAGGEIDALDPGAFGTVTISTSLTIDGGGTLAAVSVSGGNGITINAGPTDVVILRDLKLQGLGEGAAGIKIVSAGAVYVENCDIENFTGAGIDFEPTNAGAKLFVSNTALLDNAGGGVLLKPGATAAASIDHVRAMGNLFGVRAADGVVATVSNSDASGNVQNGFQTVSTAAAAQMNLQSDAASDNGMNGVTSEGANALVTFADLTATGNSGQGTLSVSNGALTSFGTNQIADNGKNFTPITVNPVANNGASNRTWVSGVGDDVNPGSRTAPDKTFAGAISKTSAGGEIDALDSGGFGTVTITKSITIDGSGELASILGASANGIVINAASTDVVILRGLKLQGAGNGLAGIKIVSAGAVYIEDCDIENFSGAGIDFEPTNAGAQLFVIDTTLDDDASGGVIIRPNGVAARAVLDGVQTLGCGFGVEVDGTNGAGAAADVTVANSAAAGNTGNGFQLAGAATGSVLNLWNVAAGNNGENGVLAKNVGAVVNYDGLTATGNLAAGTAALNGGVLNATGTNQVADNNKAFTLIALNPVTSGAAATRTWVSGVGDDANPASRTAPAKTFAGAISKTNAGGEIDALDSGGFGALTITKSLTIDGGDVLASVQTGSGANGIVINAVSTDVVVLRDLKLQGTGGGLAGIKILSAGAVYIEDCDIENFSGAGIDFEPTDAGCQLFVINTTLDDDAGGGVLIKPGVSPSVRAFLSGVTAEGCGFGVEADGGADVAVVNGAAVGNTGNGVQAGTAAAGAVVNLWNVASSNNGANGVAAQGANTVVNYDGLTATGNSGAATAALGGGVFNVLGSNLLTDNNKGFTPNALPSGSTASRTWVSGVGDDANPGSRTAPDKTFAGAISKTSAGGEIDALTPGGFGNLTITKSITIDGSGAFASVLSLGANGIVVNAASTDVVVLRGLKLQGAGTGLAGIKIVSAGAVYIEDCDVENFSGAGIDFEPTDAGAQLFVIDTTLVNNGGGGVLVKPNGVAARAFIDGVETDGNAFGVRAADRADATAVRGTAAGNSTYGFGAVAAGAGAVLSVEGGVSTINANGVSAQGPSGGSSSVSAAVNLANFNALGNSVAPFAAGAASPADSFINVFQQVVPARDFVAAEFPGLGVWQFDSLTGALRQLTPSDASVLATDAGGDVAADFTGYGVFRYTQATQGWQQLTTTDSPALAIDAAGDVFAELSGQGVVEYPAAGGSASLHSGDAALLTADAAGDVFGQFNGYGVYKYTASTGAWTLLNGTQATLLAADAAGDLFINFVGAGVVEYAASGGVQTINGTQATQLAVDAAGDAAVIFQGYAGVAEKTASASQFMFISSSAASRLTVAGNGDVFAVLADNNLWEFSNLGATQRQLTVPANGVTMPGMDAAGDLIADVSGQGVLRYTAASGWKPLNTTGAALLAVNANGDVAADFTNYGVYLYRKSTGAWANLGAADASLVAIDNAGDVFAEFPGYGLYSSTGGGPLTAMHTGDANLLAADGNGDLAVNFPGYGLYRYTAAAGFQLLNGNNATLLAIDAAGDVYANLTGLGVYRFLAGGTAGVSLNGTQATQLATDAAGDLFVAFQGYAGVYRSAFASPAAFQQITAANPTLLTDDVFGDVFLDFPAGFDRYTAGGLQLLTGTEGTPTILA